MVFESAGKYIESKSSQLAKIQAIDQIIDALLLTAATAASDDNISEYWLNDGQTQIKTIYKGTHSVYRSIDAFRRLKQDYMNGYNGRMIRLMDAKNFNGNGGR